MNIAKIDVEYHICDKACAHVHEVEKDTIPIYINIQFRKLRKLHTSTIGISILSL